MFVGKTLYIRRGWEGKKRNFSTPAQAFCEFLLRCFDEFCEFLSVLDLVVGFLGVLDRLVSFYVFWWVSSSLGRFLMVLVDFRRFGRCSVMVAFLW